MENNKKKLRSFGTHDGTFHADEVTACALLLLFNYIDRDKIVRSRDLDKLSQCEYICDVGGTYQPEKKIFDHHQVDYQGNLSSAGMILLYLKEQGTLSEKEYRFFNHSLIMGVDAHDNGRDVQVEGVCSYSQVIGSYVPLDQNSDPSKIDKAFFVALDFALGLLDRMWKRYQYVQSCREVVLNAMAKQDRFLMFDRNIPWMDVFFESGGEQHPALFVIMPSDNHWNLRGIPPTHNKRMQVRQPLPAEWAGLLANELKLETGISGAIFCHKGRFISVWETRDDALKALQQVLEMEKTV